MATIITMPRLSDTMTEGTVATWLKKVGDKISEGDILAEIETDKATMEFESFNEGTLLYIGIPAGETAAVDSLLAIIGTEGEDISALLSGNAAATTPEQTTTATKVEEVKPAAAAALPKGVVVVTMPRLSDTMTEGTVATWLKKVGDKVTEGEILAEIETDKATMEFESFNEGTLLYIGIEEGNAAPIDSLLAIIGPAGTDISGIASNFTIGGGATAAPATTEAQPAAATQTEPVVQEAAPDGQRILASPLAKKIASDKGIQLNQVKGTGENGRIVKSDIENYTPNTAAPAAQAVATTNAPAAEKATEAPKVFVPAGEVFKEEIKNSQMRKIIAKRLAESLFTAPHYNLTIEVTMDEAMKSRAIINSVPDTKVSFNDMVIKACAMALKKHLKINSQWKEDAITINHHVNIGVAVAVEDGLVVPVLKFTDAMSLSQIGGSVRDLAGRAKTKKLLPSEMEGSTFTVSNLGMFGITEFNSIINQPNSAILSVGAIVEKPVVKNGQIVVGNTMMLSLACDHRTIDGATGAQFLQTLKQYIENPVTMLA
ncbi:pyruvate dehydrogenase complex dihydrolipoamide acetyltransferase [Flavobacterium muglaense]|uniref:Dihydrolipoamide acetyltransferase component of pyruvate dehydrogenase complex n=1 Tax=Flavobacterium muglaense TaxID=2764716 RepID=A0A923N1B1_9FLAO|nr:pyruvate dehydrogenase complex dihydrolipoamide acetyltransferase [Flavobacterium muglaense]MBC5839066.1 2-oxo acid dehydrogenase subunit E2 [Flavobacterium muglaense]MBC5845541.1 2-oxo acid dehydrogenase subunit E2 [Flavobacterium muglaense]